MKSFAGISGLVLLAATAAATAQDDFPTIELGGRAQLDYAFYDDDVRDLGDGGEVRRARLFAAGSLAADWSYKAQFDFAGGDVATKDLYLAYTALPAGTLTIGQFKQPLSLENLTSSKYLTFLERALPTGLASDRRLGVGYETGNNRYHFAASAYGREVDEQGLDEGLGAGTRLVFTPVRGDRDLLHFGAAVAWEEAPSADDSLRLRQRPESHVTSVRLVDTGTMTGVEDLTRAGLEAAWVRGPFSVQAELLGIDVSRRTGDFSGGGWYIFGSWFLTGESRPYKNGAFGRVKPREGRGAWEVALRYSTLDFDDGAVSGGEEDNITLGLNYYVTPHLKFQGNLTRVRSTRGGIDDDPDILQFRVAYDF
jgi:phosphate-selective porin OprO/OprP